MPRFCWNTIGNVGIRNGIYLFFEVGENYYEMDRVVLVGTHYGDGNLLDRLKKEHFADKGRSIFRRYVGIALLKKEDKNHPYLSAWDKPILNRDYDNNPFLLDVEKKVTQYMRECFSFTCFPVATLSERRHLEKGIIAALNKSPDFAASGKWLGLFSTKPKVIKSGTWLQQGLNSAPLLESEYVAIEASCLDRRST